MSSSSAPQAELNFVETALASRAFVPTSPRVARSPQSSTPDGAPSVPIADSSSVPLIIPSAGVDQALYAITARQAGRINASSVSPKERQELLEERHALLDKKYAGSITRKEENRLTYVRWSLDRIEDAMYGAGLEDLESTIASYEQFHTDLQEFKKELSERKVSKRAFSNRRYSKRKATPRRRRK
jgi:hypothetical protein